MKYTLYIELGIGNAISYMKDFLMNYFNFKGKINYTHGFVIICRRADICKGMFKISKPIKVIKYLYIV